MIFLALSLSLQRGTLGVALAGIVGQLESGVCFTAKAIDPVLVKACFVVKGTLRNGEPTMPIFFQSAVLKYVMVSTAHFA